MSIQLRTIDLTSDEILKELVTDSLPHILGKSFEVISSNMPFEGNHILCLDSGKNPAVVTYDGRDGGRALLAGLAAIEELSDNRGMLFRLYPALFRGDPQRNNSIFRNESIRLIILSSKAPPGMAYLGHAFPSLTVHTFRVLEVDGRIGLLIEPPQGHTNGASKTNELSMPPPGPAFRAGDLVNAALSREEQRYFEDA